MGMILRIASSRIVGQGDIVGRSGYFSLNLSANSVMRGRLDARRTLKSLVADLRDIKDEVRESFTFDKNKANSRSLNMLEILDKDENAVSLHIRRGDYLQPKHWATTGSVCQLPYYQNAIAEMSRRVASPSYYIFSDDIAWVKENLPLQNAVYIDWNTDEDSWQDMMLMSHCKHHIICNSTFSWWGAWLNPNMDKTVIVPSRWFQHSEAPDIYPTGWIKVPVS